VFTPDSPKPLFSPKWKMPTGLTDPGEDIATAAVRELKEETGLDCIFDHIICFRQAHGGLFNRSDMFFVCLCKLAPRYDKLLEDGKEIELIPQEEEILCADWIDMEDYAQQQVWKESPLYKEMNGAMLRAVRNGIEYNDGHSESSLDEKANGATHGFVAKNLPVGFRPGSNTIYVSSKL
jgi:ADP-ribose pyrophosphatase YjhB (NUDIX family)